jgi:hypothetical protein
MKPVLCCLSALLALPLRADPLADQLARLGTWDGTTETAALAGPYEDPLQQNVPFGRRSYYLAPWRAWMDTQPAARFLDCLGINFNVGRPQDQEAVATLLDEAGFHHARVEVGWGNMDWDHPDQLTRPTAERLAATLGVLERHHIRPLILLNANSGWPVPIKSFRVKLLADAPAGAREIAVDRLAEIVPGRTGLRGQDYQIAYPLVVAREEKKLEEREPARAGTVREKAVDVGVLALSAPLKRPLKAGTLELFTLKYAPFGAGPQFKDGRPNPELAETVEGWNLYVSGLLRFVRDTLATGDAKDAGFDVEVWNELTFGSQFLEDRNYYSPPRPYDKNAKWTYTHDGRSNDGFTNLLCMTADHVADAASGLPGVRVITGFSNQWPWDSGTAMWPTQTGFSRHYYTGLAPFNPADPKVGTVCAATMTAGEAHSGPLNALGQPDGTSDHKDWHTVVPGTFFVPTSRRGMPEYWFYAYQTEFLARDVQPFPGPWKDHYRFGHPGTYKPAEVWQTEFNTDREAFIDSLIKQGAASTDPALHDLAQALGAKSLLRAYVFYSHKGVKTMTVFAAQDRDFSLAVLPEAFYRALKAGNGTLDAGTRAEAGPQLTQLGRVSRLLGNSEALGECRPLSVAALVEHHPRLVFAGDGTAAHPDRFHRDDFAVLPFQLAGNRYAVGYYVVTRDLGHVWDATKGLLDPLRYSLPDQDFDLTLSNVAGTGATLALYDPATDRTTPLTADQAAADRLTVRLPATDQPRFLLITEAKPGPLVQSPTLTGTKVAFTANVAGMATVTWGAFPQRTGGGSKDLAVAAGQRVELNLPSLGAKDAVRVALKAGGLEAPWPRWDYDVAGQVH